MKVVELSLNWDDTLWIWWGRLGIFFGDQWKLSWIHRGTSLDVFVYIWIFVVWIIWVEMFLFCCSSYITKRSYPLFLGFLYSLVSSVLCNRQCRRWSLLICSICCKPELSFTAFLTRKNAFVSWEEKYVPSFIALNKNLNKVLTRYHSGRCCSASESTASVDTSNKCRITARTDEISELS